jgi:hypothetical protein
LCEFKKYIGWQEFPTIEYLMADKTMPGEEILKIYIVLPDL